MSAAVILIIHAVGLWKYQSQQYQRKVRKCAVLLLAASLAAIGLAGYNIVQNPSLLKESEQRQ